MWAPRARASFWNRTKVELELPLVSLYFPHCSLQVAGAHDAMHRDRHNLRQENEVAILLLIKPPDHHDHPVFRERTCGVFPFLLQPGVQVLGSRCQATPIISATQKPRPASDRMATNAGGISCGPTLKRLLLFFTEGDDVT